MTHRQLPQVLRLAKASNATLMALLVLGTALTATVWRWRQHADAVDPTSPPPANNATAAGAEQIGSLDPAALRIKAWHRLDELPHDLAQFETVFWERQDTDSLRRWLADYAPLSGARVLEIGTGTGLIALYCLQCGAQQVVATDINPVAVANARYNAELMRWSERIDVRLVTADHPAPFAVIDSGERFDLIISNPPWEDAEVEEVAAYALYDPGFQLLDGLLRDGSQPLRPGGKLLLAYGATAPIERIISTSPPLGWQVTVHDDRQLVDLPEVFVPGVLLELRRQ